MGIVRVEVRRDAAIAAVERVGPCRAALRAPCACDGSASACCDPPTVTATSPGARLLEPWELRPLHCACPWCRWGSLVAAQRRARDASITAARGGPEVAALPPELMAWFERPDLRAMGPAAVCILPRLMGPAWWGQEPVLRRPAPEGSRP